jgi:Trypsin
MVGGLLVLGTATALGQNTARAVPSPTGQRSGLNGPPHQRMLGGIQYNLVNTQLAYIENSRASCTGTLVGDRLILTAAHCLNDPLENYRVVVDGRLYRASEAYRHPWYRPLEQFSYENAQYDLAVLVLSDSVLDLDPVLIVRNWSFESGERATVLGFGTNEVQIESEQSLADRGRLGDVVVQDSAGGLLYAEGWATGVSVCAGDSGGPLLQAANRQRYTWINGVVSAGTNTVNGNGACTFESAGVSIFVDLTSYSSQEFLRSIPGLRYLNKGFLAVSLSAKREQQTLQATLRSQRIEAIWPVTDGSADRLSALLVYADWKRERRLVSAIRILRSIADTGPVREARGKVRKAIGVLSQIKRFPVVQSW